MQFHQPSTVIEKVADSVEATKDEALAAETVEEFVLKAPESPEMIAPEAAEEPAKTK